VAGYPNMVLAVDGDTAVVRTDQSPGGQSVGVGEVQKGLDKLVSAGSVRVSVEELGHRSAFVGAVLATLPGARLTKAPAAVTLSAPPYARQASDPEFAVLDLLASVKIRREQTQLRNLLAGGRDRRPARCAATSTRWGSWWPRTSSSARSAPTRAPRPAPRGDAGLQLRL
jgi:hypothetical protein